MFLRIAHTLVLALAAIVAIAGAPALAQTDRTTVTLDCSADQVVHSIVPDAFKVGLFRSTTAHCGAKAAWLLPVPGKVIATFSSAADVTAYLTESDRSLQSAWRSQDNLVKQITEQLKAAENRAREAETNIIKAVDNAVAAIKDRDAMAAKLKAAEAELAALKAVAKPAGS